MTFAPIGGERPSRQAGQPRFLLLFLALLLTLGTPPNLRADKSTDGRLDPEILRRTKQATVYLRVTLPSGAVVQGSGFFGVEPGLVLTNAHVLGMLRPQSPRPKKVDVVINSGERNERILPATVLGVDADSDLGMLRVKDKDLPAPLKVDEHKAVQETDPVYIFGFPFGKDLGKSVTVSRSSISSIRKDDKGLTIQKIQVNGGMHPGNSGGPVIVDSGEVVGVSVSGIKSTTINFAVPARSVAYFALGRRRSAVFGTPYKEGDKVRVPVHVEMIDPLQRIQQVWWDVWTGDPGKTREASEAKLDPQPGDSPREKCLLTYKDGGADGELVLPANPPAKKVFWVQFVYTTSAKKKAWNSAFVYRPLPPVERKPVVLKHQHYPGTEGTWKLTSTATFQLRDEDDVDHPLALKLAAELRAATADKLEKGIATTTLRPSKFEVSVLLDGKAVGEGQKDDSLERELQFVSLLAREQEDGLLEQAVANIRRVPRDSQKHWKQFGDQMVASLESVSWAMPGTEVAVGKPWKATRPLSIFILGSSSPASGELTYQYLGTRARRGRQEAVVTFEGEVRGLARTAVTVGGRIHGEAVIDLATGCTILSQSTLDIELEVQLDKQKVKAGGTLAVRLERPLPEKAKSP